MMQPTPGVGPPVDQQQQQQQQQQWMHQQQQMMMQMQQQQQQHQAMVMQQPHMMTQQHYPPQLPPQQLPLQQPQSSDEVKTLWVGDLQYWMDENYLHTCFSHTGEKWMVPECLCEFCGSVGLNPNKTGFYTLFHGRGCVIAGLGYFPVPHRATKSDDPETSMVLWGGGGKQSISN
eukprot:Gb_20977 [translate_table: standard]